MTVNSRYLPLFFLVSILHAAHGNGNEGFKGKSCDDIEVVTRDEWRARPPWRDWRMKVPVNDVIIIHTADSECHSKAQCIRLVNAIQEYHMDDRAWGDVAYNFFVGGDGRIYEGKGWTTPGSHSVNFNTNSIGIAFMGDYSRVTPGQKMVDAALKLIACGVKRGYLTPTREIHGHRDVACTESPGDQLYAIIRSWKNYIGGRLPLYDC